MCYFYVEQGCGTFTLSKGVVLLRWAVLSPLKWLWLVGGLNLSGTLHMLTLATI